MEKTNVIRVVTLFLSIILIVSCFVACGNVDAENKITSPNTDTNHNDPVNDDVNSNQNTSSWVMDALKSGDDISAYPFYEDLAYVRIDDKSYFIDKTGDVKITLSSNPVFNAEAIQSQARFYNGLFFMTDHLINATGEKITAQDLGGTALHTTNIDYKLLEGGYIVVDKVASDFAGATYESAIYNTELELVQPYSADLYALFHPDITTGRNLQFFNGYIYFNDYRELENSWETEEYIQTYHIATNTYAAYDAIPQVIDKLYYNNTVGEIQGLYKADKLILDLSGYNTLTNVECVGEFGLAKFQNEEGQGYFTIIDTAGNFKFEPILFSNMRNYGDSCQFNGSLIMVKTFLGLQDGTQKYQIKTFDLTGKELGCIEETTTSGNQLYIAFGDDTIVIENQNAGSICYYNTSLAPLFPTE